MEGEIHQEQDLAGDQDTVSLQCKCVLEFTPFKRIYHMRGSGYLSSLWRSQSTTAQGVKHSNLLVHLPVIRVVVLFIL